MTATPPMRNNELREFAKTHARELVRDRRAVVAILLSFAAILALLWGMDLLITGATNRPAHLLQTSLSLVSTTGFMAVALVATTVPLVRYRSIGILRQLSTTSARRAAFLLGHVPIRAAIICAESVIILAAAIAGGSTVGDAMPLAVTLLIGGAMLLSFGYLLASRMTNLDFALQLAYIIPLVILLTSGALLPLDIYPEPIQNLFQALPSTWFVDTFNAQLHGSTPLLPLGVMWASMALMTIGIAYVSLRFYRWQRTE